MAMSTFGGKGLPSTAGKTISTSTQTVFNRKNTTSTTPGQQPKKPMPENTTMNEVLNRASKKGQELQQQFIKKNDFGAISATGATAYNDYLNKTEVMKIPHGEDVFPVQLDEFFKELDESHRDVAKILRGNMASAGTRYSNAIREIGIDNFIAKTKIEGNIVLTHTSSRTKEIEGKNLTSDEQIESIVNSRKLKNVGLSTGVASQSGICMSSDILSKSTIDALLGKLNSSMVFYLVDKNNLEVSRSMYSLSDQTTLVDKSENLSIIPVAYNKSEGKFVVLDHDKFVKKVLANLISNEIHLNASFLFKTAALIEELGFTLKDKKGKEWTSDELVHLDTLKIIKIIRDSLFYIAKDNHKIFRKLAKQVELHAARHEAIEKYCNQYKNDSSVGSLLKETGLEKIVEFLSKAYEDHRSEQNQNNEETQTNSKSFKL